MKGKNKTGVLELILGLIVLVGAIGALYGVPGAITNQIIAWLVSAFIGATFSIIAGSFVEAITGDTLKGIFLSVPITENISLPVSLFAIATFLVKVWFFGF